MLRFLSAPSSHRWRLLLPLLTACALSSLGLCARSQTNVTVTTPTEAALDAAIAQVAGMARSLSLVTEPFPSPIPKRSPQGITHAGMLL